MNRLRFTLPLVFLSALLAASGCDEPSANTIELSLAELPPSAGLTPSGDWQSVGWLGDPWQRYAGKTTLVMEHTDSDGDGLGHEPSSVLVYLSFDESGGSAALSAGDMARIVAVDDRFVTICNHTEASFFARIVLR